MSQIKQLLLLHEQGKGCKAIARQLGLSKNTVKSYLHKLASLTSGDQGLESTISALMQLELPVLESRFHSGNPAYKDARYDYFKDRAAYFVSELTRVGVHKKLLWEEYRAENPDGYSYSQFCFHLQQQQIASNPSMKLLHKAGEKLYVDFAGSKLSYIDKETGEVIECQVFAACLPYSDYSFAMAVRSQTTEDFLYALRCCLEDIGGAPQALVPDNLKAAVIKANRYEPNINSTLEDFANHYGTTVFPARVRKPKDKALVENAVKLIYSRVYAKIRNMRFFDLHSLNEAIRERMKAHNQTRMQQKPYSREELFVAEEKKHLYPLPADRFELKYYRELKVAKNNHVCLTQDKHYYSVPFQFIGIHVKVIYTRSMVYIFAKGEQVAVHTRGYKPSGYTTDKDHLCSQHRHYLDRSPDYYLQQAQIKSKVLHELIRHIFDHNTYPEQLYRTCDGLFSLHRKTQADVFNSACQLAIDHQNYSYSFIRNILTNKMTEQAPASDERKLPDHENLRGKEYYQLQLKF